MQIFRVGEKENISYCQFYMQQLPVEIQFDFKRMCYLRKLVATDCILLSHIFECCSKFAPILMSALAISAMSQWQSDQVPPLIFWTVYGF